MPLSADGKPQLPYLECAQRYGLNWVHSVDRPGLSSDPSLIHQGGNSGYQALNLAVLLGAARILLLGYDMGGRGHWHGNHPPGLRNPPESQLSEWAGQFHAAAADLDRLGIECINCSRETALTCFPRARIEDVL